MPNNNTIPKEERDFVSLQRMGRKGPAKCPSQKRRFRDHDEATAVLHKAKNARTIAKLDQTGTRRREQRSYECAQCQGWHVTSQSTWQQGRGN